MSTLFNCLNFPATFVAQATVVGGIPRAIMYSMCMTQSASASAASAPHYGLLCSAMKHACPPCLPAHAFRCKHCWLRSLAATGWLFQGLEEYSALYEACGDRLGKMLELIPRVADVMTRTIKQAQECLTDQAPICRYPSSMHELWSKLTKHGASSLTLLCLTPLT